MGKGTPREPPDAIAPDAEVSLRELPLHSATLLTVLDHNSVIQYESPSIEHVFGYKQDELVGEPVAEYFHPDDRARVVDAFQRIVACENAETVEALEYRHKRADGSYVWVESVASADPTPSGYYVINTRDISDRKAREHQLEQTNERLEEFASVVSHDLRNPLTIARGHLQLAEEECSSAHHETVANALGRMETLVDDLLSLARAGQQLGALEWIDLRGLAESCWQTVASAEATLQIAIDRHIHADQSRMQQLLENLMQNAVDHGGDGVTVSIGELDDQTGFYVEDDGPGIPENQRSNVFETGFSTTDRGTGLGLSVVKEIVEAHGWGIAITESSGGGARFEITGVDFQ